MSMPKSARQQYSAIARSATSMLRSCYNRTPRQKVYALTPATQNSGSREALSRWNPRESYTDSKHGSAPIQRSMLETETDSEAEASEVVVKRRAILWDMAVGEQIRYEVATIRKCMVILGRLSSFFGEDDPETGKRLGELGAHLADVVELVENTWKGSAAEINNKNHSSIV